MCYYDYILEISFDTSGSINLPVNKDKSMHMFTNINIFKKSTKQKGN